MTSGYSEHWQDTINLLRLVQSDCEVVRKQIDTVSHALAEREILVSQRLQHALLLSAGYQPLCLMPSGYSIVANQIGKTILGASIQTTIPKALQLEIRCFDRFAVRSNTRKVERWHSSKAKSILQYLMTRPQEPIAKDLIMEALWPEHDQQTASNSLKVAIHSLKKLLNYLLDQKENFPCITFLQGGYLVNPEIDLWLDVEQFEQHWATGRRLEREGNATAAIREFELAEALYKCDYLEDRPYDEWTLLRRETLKDTYLIILGKLADHAMETSDYESCIIYCQRILAKEPCREDTYRRLIRCYSRLGNKNRSLHWYEICCRTILAEIDAAPDRETVALYHQLLRNEYI
ncbi:BTAD domain-containing putative transcriptional regulator [Chloroflexota bacterium]